MAIGLAVQRGNTVYIYDEKGRQLFVKTGKLHGYTSGTVSVKGVSPTSRTIFTYNAKGSQVSVTTT